MQMQEQMQNQARSMFAGFPASRGAKHHVGQRTAGRCERMRAARTPNAKSRAQGRLRLPRLPQGAGRFGADPHAAARRGLRHRAQTTTAPTSWSSTPAASSTPRSQESLDAIGEALAENGKVIVTGCLGRQAATCDRARRIPSVLAVTGPHATQR